MIRLLTEPLRFHAEAPSDGTLGAFWVKFPVGLRHTLKTVSALNMASRPISVNLVQATHASSRSENSCYLANKGFGGLESSVCPAMTVFEGLEGDCLKCYRRLGKNDKMGLDANAVTAFKAPYASLSLLCHSESQLRQLEISHLPTQFAATLSLLHNLLALYNKKGVCSLACAD